MHSSAPLFLFTDFGPSRLYTGQMIAAIRSTAAQLDVIELLDDAPAYDIQASGHLLAALLPGLPAQAVVLAVVDPGVGGERAALIVEADGRFLVGPDNGLFDRLVQRAGHLVAHRIEWRPRRLSQTFHGRDLFAPVAARLASRATWVDTTAFDYKVPPAVADPIEARVIYADSYGNCMTDLYATECDGLAGLRIGQVECPRLQRFEQARKGSPLCYENSLGLIELAVNQGSAAAMFGLGPGDRLGMLRR